MPRGLGEDPLTRRRKASRLAVSQFAAGGPVPGSSGLVSPSQSPAQGGAAVDVFSSRPTAHNDVFFRKRSESGPTSISPPPVQEAVEPAISEPALATASIAEPVVAEPSIPDSIEAVPAISSPTFEEAAQSVSEPAPQAPLTPEEVAPAKSVAPDLAATERSAPAHGEPAPQEGGILKRLFGRFHK